MVLSALGRMPEAVAEMRRSIALDPDSSTRFLAQMWADTWSRASPEPAAQSGSAPE
jgi:hypothetical protein